MWCKTSQEPDNWDVASSSHLRALLLTPMLTVPKYVCYFPFSFVVSLCAIPRSLFLCRVR